MADGIKVEEKLSFARNSLLERQHLQGRLQDLFLSITPSQLPPIYTKNFPNEKNESVVVYFDHGLDPDPLFSGEVTGRIYLDKDKNLNLAIWPLEKTEKNRPWRKEILMKGVSHFQFQFLGEKQTKDDKAISANWAWHKRWSKKRMEIPAMIRLSITQEDKEISFAFFLTKAEPFITYWKEKYTS